MFVLVAKGSLSINHDQSDNDELSKAEENKNNSSKNILFQILSDFLNFSFLSVSRSDNKEKLNNRTVTFNITENNNDNEQNLFSSTNIENKHLDEISYRI